MNVVNETVRDFAYYRVVSFNLPLAVIVISLLVGIALVILTCVGRCLCCLESCCAVRFLLDVLRDIMLRIISFSLFEFKHKKRGKEHIYLLYGVRVSVYALNFLSVLLLGIMFASLISFWNTFLTESTIDECDSRADCFQIFRSAGIMSRESERITDCNNIVMNDERRTTVCFRMAYRYSEGLGEAGGFLFSMQVITNIFIYIIVRIVRVVLKVTKILIHKNVADPDSTQFKYRIKCVSFFAKLVAMLLVQAVYAGILIVLPLQLVVLRSDFRQTLVTPNRLLQLILYSYTICLLFLVPLFVGIFVQGYDVYEDVSIDSYVKGKHSASKTDDLEAGQSEDLELNT